jgi:branched-chain amino acid transport system permease protein
MSEFLALTIAGIATYGCVYALTAMGLVVTYTTSGIFNFAQGAIGMIGAFLYWQLNQDLHWPGWLALILVVFVIMPLIGAGIEAAIMRRLENAPLEARLTVTIALLLLGIAVATVAWDPQVSRFAPQFFAGHQVTIGSIVLSWHQLLVVAAAVLAAAGLRLFFYRVRAGIATRAVVDDRELAALTGATPARYAQLGWAIGCSLASLAGILIAPLINLDVTLLTLLVINGYAAALVGRLTSLPWTFVGAIVLGLIQSYAIGYLPTSETWTFLDQVIPMAFLVVVLLVLPQAKASLSRRVRVPAIRNVSLRQSLGGSGLLLVVAIVVAQTLSQGNLSYACRGVALAIIGLSIVLLTGYGGQVSLCQVTFAGLGAVAMSKVGGSDGSLLGILAAVGLAGAVGALLALPALRLRGLYLALATFAFAYGMDNAFFNNIQVFGTYLSLQVARPHIPGISLASNGAYLVLLCVVFAAVSVGLLATRRSRYGRKLLAVNDSPSACLTLGVDMTRVKLVTFTASAALAGLGGALYAGAQGAVAPADFTFLISLTMLLLAVIWGIRTTVGMLFAGVSYALGPILQQHLNQPRDVVLLLVGLAAIGISRNPEGAFGGDTPLAKWRARRTARLTLAGNAITASGFPATIAAVNGARAGYAAGRATGTSERTGHAAE